MSPALKDKVAIITGAGRSLGKTELVGIVNDITRAGDYLILHLGAAESVTKHVRGNNSQKLTEANRNGEITGRNS